jgi:transcriptional regulator with XRE-family HTH domain
MTGGDFILMARRRAGLSQRELADLVGCRQATIARWEHGDRRPSFADVEAAAAACELDLEVHLTRKDRSWWPQIAEQLELTPLDRVRRLSPSSALADQLERLARGAIPAIVLGEAAGALHGWPLALSDGPLELCLRPSPTGRTPAAPRTTAGAGHGRATGQSETALLISKPPGTAGFGDLARGAATFEIDAGEVSAAGLLDLLRIADASPAPDARRHALAYQAVLDVHRARQNPTHADQRGAEERISEWLSRQTPVA